MTLLVANLGMAESDGDGLLHERKRLVTYRPNVLGAITLVAILSAAPGVAVAQAFNIYSTFDADTPGSPPATGGPNQPSSIIDGGVLVQSSSNGIVTQPLEVDDGTCNQSYFGGVAYYLPTLVTSGRVTVEATVAINQLTDGVFFDASSNQLGNSIARIDMTDDGTLTDHFGVVLSPYTPNTPVRFHAEIDMDTGTWDCTIDDELNGFADDPVTQGLAFVNPPSIIPNMGTATFTIFGSFSSCIGSRVVAFDNVWITNDPPFFADGFESGDTTAWTFTLP